MLSFIYFDIGGVLIQDYSATNKWEDMKAALGVVGEKKVLFENLWAKYEPRLCLDLDADELGRIIAKKLDLKLPHEFSLLNEFIIRFSQNRQLWPLIDQIKNKVNLGLLTNIYPRMLEKLFSAHLLPPINWQVTIDSSSEGLKKPDPEIFQLAIKKAGVPADQILFVDNTQENVIAAKKLGLQTFFYDSFDYHQSSQKLARFIQEHL